MTSPFRREEPPVAGQDYWLADEYSSRRPDPDPRDAGPDWDDVWDPAENAWVPRPSGLIALITGIVLGLLVGIVLGFTAASALAAPRSGQTTERVDTSAPSSAGLSGAPPTVAVSPSASPTPAGRPSAAPRSTPRPEPTARAAGTTRSGSASWCAPTPRYCRRWGGDARLAAVRSFSWGDAPYTVRVCRTDDRSRCVLVTVVSFCACTVHLIDLSPAAFRRLERQSRGTVDVVVAGLR